MQADQSQSFSGEKARWNRFLLTSAMFVLYESLLIGFLGDYFYAGVASELGVWSMGGAAAFGYLLYGIYSRTLLSIFVLAVPIFLALGLDPSVPQEALGSEAPPIYVLWAFWSIFFVPAWVVGLLISNFVPGNGGRGGR